MGRTPPFFSATAVEMGPVVPAPEEALVQDTRAGVTPAQMVERKLASLGGSCPLLRSRMQTAALSRPA